MASQSIFSEEDFSCTLCLDIFKDPVILLCSHSFCNGCLQWGKKKLKECPVCKKISSIDHPPRNLPLKKLCEAFIESRHQRAKNCTNHIPRPITALGCIKEDLQKSQKTLKKKLKALNANRQTCVQTAAYIKHQAKDTKREIKEQFQKLHQFLQDEEEACISALREEKECKSQLMKERIKGLSRDISYISDTSRAIDAQLRAEDCRRTMMMVGKCERIQCTSFDPTGAQIDVAKHTGNLAYRTCDKMKDIVSRARHAV